MDDLTFLRNLASRGRVALLAGAAGPDVIAVPTPTSVLEDESMAGYTFRIPLLSPEGVWSGDGRNFKPGTVEHRELPLPLLWQPMLDDGHKTGVVVGRMDSMTLTPDGWGEVHGVFDTGPWGREAQRLVDAGMLRFVSADYDDFEAAVVEKNDDDDEVIKDNRTVVNKSRIMAATIVAKPAFQESTIEITTNPLLEDGVFIAEPLSLAASADQDLILQLQQRLARLEALQINRRQAELAVLASAARERTTAARETRRANLLNAAEAARLRVRAERGELNV